MLLLLLNSLLVLHRTVGHPARHLGRGRMHGGLLHHPIRQAIAHAVAHHHLLLRHLLLHHRGLGLHAHLLHLGLLLLHHHGHLVLHVVHLSVELLGCNCHLVGWSRLGVLYGLLIIGGWKGYLFWSL